MNATRIRMMVLVMAATLIPGLAFADGTASGAQSRGGIGRAVMAPVRGLAGAIGSRMVARGRARDQAGHARVARAVQIGRRNPADVPAARLRNLAWKSLTGARSNVARGNVAVARIQIATAREDTRDATREERTTGVRLSLSTTGPGARSASERNRVREERRGYRQMVRGLQTQARGERLVQFSRR